MRGVEPNAGHGGRVRRRECAYCRAAGQFERLEPTVTAFFVFKHFPMSTWCNTGVRTSTPTRGLPTPRVRQDQGKWSFSDMVETT